MSAQNQNWTNQYSVAILGIGLTVLLVGYSEIARAMRDPVLDFAYANVAWRAESVALDTYWPRIVPCGGSR